MLLSFNGGSLEMLMGLIVGFAILVVVGLVYLYKKFRRHRINQDNRT